MLSSMIYKMFLKIRPIKRITKYGTVAYRFFDERTKTEKVFDWIEERIKPKVKRKKESYAFKSFFCIPVGRMITSRSELREVERDYHIGVSERELRQEAEKVQRRKQETFQRESMKRLERKVQDYYRTHNS